MVHVVVPEPTRAASQQQVVPLAERAKRACQFLEVVQFVDRVSERHALDVHAPHLVGGVERARAHEVLDDLRRQLLRRLPALVALAARDLDAQAALARWHGRLGEGRRERHAREDLVAAVVDPLVVELVGRVDFDVVEDRRQILQVGRRQTHVPGQLRHRRRPHQVVARDALVAGHHRGDPVPVGLYARDRRRQAHASATGRQNLHDAVGEPPHAMRRVQEHRVHRLGHQRVA